MRLNNIFSASRKREKCMGVKKEGGSGFFPYEVPPLQKRIEPWHNSFGLRDSLLPRLQPLFRMWHSERWRRRSEPHTDADSSSSSHSKSQSHSPVDGTQRAPKDSAQDAPEQRSSTSGGVWPFEVRGCLRKGRTGESTF